MLRVLKLLHSERDRASDLGTAKMHQRQKFGVRPSLSLIGLDHDMSLTCLLLKHRETQSRGYFFVFSPTAGRTGAPSDFFLVAPLRN